MPARFDEDKNFAQNSLENYLTGKNSPEIIIGRMKRYIHSYCKKENGSFEYDDFIKGYSERLKKERSLTNEDIVRIARTGQSQ